MERSAAPVRRLVEMLGGASLQGWLSGLWVEVVDSWFPCMCAVCGAATLQGKCLCAGCAAGVIRLRRGGGGESALGARGIRGDPNMRKLGGRIGRGRAEGGGGDQTRVGVDVKTGTGFTIARNCKGTGQDWDGNAARDNVAWGNGAGGGALCVCCSRLFEGAQAAPGEFCGPCAECARLRPAFVCAVAPVKAAGAVREVVHAFKYEGRRHLCGVLTDWMQEGLADPRLRSPPVDAWVPVPLHRSRLRTRGFNQAGLLAAELGRRTGVEVLDVLERVRSTGSQAQLGRDERLGNLRGAFQLKRLRPGWGAAPGEAPSISGRHLVLVDDVLTTGATLDACARALLESNPGSVRALTVARG